MVRRRFCLGEGGEGGRETGGAITSIRGGSVILAAALAVFAASVTAAEVDAMQAGDSAPAGMLSLRRNAVVSVGGEVATDYAFRQSRGHGAAKSDRKTADLSLRQTNLRVRADVHPGVSAFFKIDLSSNPDRDTDAAALAEEALLVMKAVGGTGLGFFAGKGKAPYGQDITLGIVQSYAHAANYADSSEGPVFIAGAPEAAAGRPAPMRPGSFDRTFLAGASYDWDERWRVEVAAFRPDSEDADRRLGNVDGGRARAGTGAAARVWWMPVAELALQASAVWARAGDLDDVARRTDIPAGAAGRRDAYALSLGFDWRGGDWRVFGEFQLARDWNFTDGYSARTWQLGAARRIGPLRLGTMAEGLRIDHGPAAKIVDNYYKLALTVRYDFANSVFLLAEYGREWLRRTGVGGAGRADGNFVGVRMGWSF